MGIFLFFLRVYQWVSSHTIAFPPDGYPLVGYMVDSRPGDLYKRIEAHFSVWHIPVGQDLTLTVEPSGWTDNITGCKWSHITLKN